jgi:hypothetical protein
VTTASIPICESCALLRTRPNGLGLVCDAFPDGIPDEIYFDGFDHRQAFPGDHDIRYIPDPGGAGRLAAYEAVQRAGALTD